jgi:hypothetical protein
VACTGLFKLRNTFSLYKISQKAFDNRKEGVSYRSNKLKYTIQPVPAAKQPSFFQKIEK